MKFNILLLVLIGLFVMQPGLKAKGDQGKSIHKLGQILSQRDRIEPSNQILKDRLENLLPGLMREAGIDMWITINREYVEDALFFTLVPKPTFAARRTTILVVSDPGDGKPLEFLTVSRYPIEGYYESVWQGGSSKAQWQRLAQVIEEREPQSIGLNISADWPLADGLTAGLYQQLQQNVPEKYQKRFTSAEKLVVRWMETRSAKEIAIYPHVVALARRVIAEAFSSKVITPGVTTTDDVAWYIRERFESLQLRPWFQPYVNLQRRGDNPQKSASFMGKPGVIMPGDVLHTDVGICYLNLCTDTQEMGYVLKMGETDAPKGLKRALERGNQWQDILTGNFKVGLTGNQILRRTIQQSKNKKLLSSTYTHPIGVVGHAAGPTIGMWDNQGDTPVKGDWKLFANTAYAIEGNVKVKVPEWNDQWVQIKLEQTAIYDGKRVYYAAGRQSVWHLVGD